MKISTGCLAAVLILQLSGNAQSKWSGGAGDGLWKSSANWMSGITPMTLPSEDVLLDNSLYPGDYTVKIVTSDSVVIHSLIIAPAEGKSITLIIDSSSTQSTALTVTSNEDGIVISKGGGIINTSRAGDGVVISITDSLRVENGGFYSHQTRRAHAALVNRLSRRAGTEYGVFEFNIPSASNTLSLANQHYGTLRLSSVRAGTSCTYSGAATSQLQVRGDLEIDAGVMLSLNFSDTIFIRRNYLQSGGTFNMANSTRAAKLMIYGDLVQSAGVITKTGVALPVLILAGNKQQKLGITGGITGNVTLKTSNMEGVKLTTPVALPYVLELSKGKVITSSSNLLTLSPGSSIIVDSTSDISFVDGPLRKQGLSETESFLFPVGKNEVHRWLCLKNGTGNFTVQYHSSNPRLISSLMQPGIDHISSTEYWAIDADASPVASGNVMLSYDETSSGGVTDLATLKVAGYMNNSSWIDGGNEGTTGSAGSSGSVLSSHFTELGSGGKFTLAGSVPMQNPLPLRLISFNALRKKDHVAVSWQIDLDYLAGHFDIEGSQDGNLFTRITNLRAKKGINKYEYNDRRVYPSFFYRLKATDKWGEVFYSRIIRMDDSPATMEFNAVRMLPSNVLECLLQTDREQVVKLELFDMTARRLLFVQQDLTAGNNTLRINPGYLPGGVYILRVSDKNKVITTRRFIK